MANKIVLSWSAQALKNLEDLYEFIKVDPDKNAQKVVNKIIEATNALELYPEKFPLDKLKRNNDGTFRAFLVFKYRISYRALPKSIKILRVRHTSREPLEY